MLGNSSTSVLATTITASSGGGGDGGGDGGGGSKEAAPQPPPPPQGSSSEVASHVLGEEEDKAAAEIRGDEGDRSFGGNRWPRQETLALLKLRSDMDVAFRDASVKGPLWEEVSRKLAELGYHRSAKKCKEKFENVYKYHKRTKEGRTGKHEGKNYRFFEQLKALENHPSNPLSSPSLPPPKPQAPAGSVAAIPMPPVSNPPHPPVSHHLTVPSPNMSQGIAPPTINLAFPTFNSSHQINISSSFPSFSPDLISNSTSSSTSSDVELQGRGHKRKRKWKEFFGRLMREVVQKQEEMQRKFLEAIEKREQERLAREESWRAQEMARINREREILAQERSMAAAKDAAVMAFLQRLSEQQNPSAQLHNNSQQKPQVQPPPHAQAQGQPQLQAPAPPQQPTTTQPPPTTPPQQLHLTPVVLPGQPVTTNVETLMRLDNGEQNLMSSSTSNRWPKVEVEALISLRTGLESKYQENGPKGPLWEEISAGMRNLGYNRNAKRCKEKWENINKYFKKVKENNKKRPEDSKTCPYFHKLEALYKEKRVKINDHGSSSTSSQLKPENSVPLMVRPEQQWPPPPPPPQQDQSHRPDTVMEDLESDDQDLENHQDEDDDEEDEAGEYEIVASKPTSMSKAE